MSPELHKDQFFYYYFMDFYQFYDLIDFFSLGCPAAMNQSELVTIYTCNF